jgi:uncharacterized protein (DUF488 family)
VAEDTATRKPAPLAWSGQKVYTLGHSTLSLPNLIELLQRHGIRTLVDIRRFPKSRRNPQFNREQLATALAEAGLSYVHLDRLGGRRHGLRDASPNQGWRNPSFRGFADYMLGEEFELGLEELLALLPGGPLALMCAESMPWRCHRSLVADALLVRGASIEHITSSGRPEAHRLTTFAQVEGHRVTYPP